MARQAKTEDGWVDFWRIDRWDVLLAGATIATLFLLDAALGIDFLGFMPVDGEPGIVRLAFGAIFWVIIAATVVDVTRRMKRRRRKAVPPTFTASSASSSTPIGMGKRELSE